MNRYDTSTDVIRKALRGHDLAPATAATLAGLPPGSLEKWLSGQSAAPLSPELASLLGLDPEAFAGFDQPFQPPPLPAGIRQLEMPFGDESVNAWWIGQKDHGLLIDTGTSPEALDEVLGGFRPECVLITHPHPDHIGSLGLFRDSAIPILDGSSMPADGLPFAGGRILAEPLPGHHPGAWGYRFEGDAASWVATGDALFAGSMGGCPDAHAFRTACASLFRFLKKAPADSLVLPGHGPPTRVGIELTRNPFAPSWHASAP